MTLVSSGAANLKSEASGLRFPPEARRAGGIGAGEMLALLRVRGTSAEPKLGLDGRETAKTAASIGADVMTVWMGEAAQQIWLHRETEAGKTRVDKPTGGIL